MIFTRVLLIVAHWLERIGVLDETANSVRDLRRSRAESSFQLVGSPDRHTLDLGVLHEAGVRIIGLTVGADGPALRLLDNLTETTATAQQALERLLARIDAVTGPEDFAPEPDAARAVRLAPGPTSINLEAEDRRHARRPRRFAADAHRRRRTLNAA